MEKIDKIVLAYSGGLDTSVNIPWLKENYGGCEIIAVVADIGQGEELESLEANAIKAGASKLYIEDLTDEFINEFVIPMMKAGAKYENYLLGTAIARPAIARRVVEIALRENADAIAHGCTGKGNDQVRFETAIKAFAPRMKIIAPWRVWEIKSREEEIEYAEARGIPLNITRETNYSRDSNLWHFSHEGLDLEATGNEPKYHKEGFLKMCVTPEQAPDKPEYIEMEFEQGVPTTLDGMKMSPAMIVAMLNKIGGRNGIGLLDLVENRLVGMKNRGVYETPGGTILYHAHGVLESICLDKETAHLKSRLALKFAELIYNGQWFTPLREALSAFVEKTQETTTGRVRLKLYKGNIINAGVWSRYSLYDSDLASFGESEYNQQDAEGFINLYSLPVKVRALMEDKRK